MPAFFHSTVRAFLDEDSSKIVGQLAVGSQKTGFLDLKQKQIEAWTKEIDSLKAAFSALQSELPTSVSWSIFLEYPIPRRQKRIDAVILAVDLIFCIEFKTTDDEFPLHAQKQVEDYALDLRDFHEQSFGHTIVPILVALEAESGSPVKKSGTSDLVRPVQCTDQGGFASCLFEAYQRETRGVVRIDPNAWNLSAYRPVPTIIEAAEALYAGQNVREIAHSQAGAENLSITSERLLEVIQHAQQKGQKVICFVTGIPGAGKTLVGLNIVHNPILRTEGRPPGVFLSGNGPLVKVVRAAINRDFKKRSKEDGVERTLGTFIQNVHAFVNDSLEKEDQPPVENIIVFDEAQRAWDAAHNKKKTDQEKSEPEVVLSIMDRHLDWAVIVALVGGGQEIHDGEAGLGEWGRTIEAKFPNWHIVASPQALKGGTSVAGQRLFADPEKHSSRLLEEQSFHLKINIRSYRSRKVAEWVEAVLAGDSSKANDIMSRMNNFPIVLTRSLSAAKTWLQTSARGLRRCGLVASSGAIRLRAEGLELSSGFRQGNRDLYVHWFLDEPPDVRSSNQLEIAATEFECQGLELDWVGMCWGADFIRGHLEPTWAFSNFSGSKWANVKKEIDQQYILNTYRVLLTRAREGMAIWIPSGDPNDPTRTPETFNRIADYLVNCGLKLI